MAKRGRKPKPKKQKKLVGTKRGRKPKPTELKKLLGNPGKRPLNKHEPQPKPTKPRPPRHLDATAKTEWKRMAPELHRMGLLTAIDRAAFAAYCAAYSRWAQAETALAKSFRKGEMPYVVTTEKGNIVQHPLVGVANKAAELMYRFLTEFGLSPSSRSRVSVPNSAVDEFEAEFGKG